METLHICWKSISRKNSAILVDPLSMCEMLKLFNKLTYSIFCSEHCSRWQKVRSEIPDSLSFLLSPSPLPSYDLILLPIRSCICANQSKTASPVGVAILVRVAAPRQDRYSDRAPWGLDPWVVVVARFNSFDSSAIIRWNSECSPCHKPGKWKWASRNDHRNHIKTIGYSTITIYWQLFLHLKQILEQHWTASLLLSD